MRECGCEVITVPRLSRRRWLLLAVPLLAGLAGSAHLLNVALRGDPQAAATAMTGQPANGYPAVRPVVAFGHVDAEDGISKLPFTVPGGRVTEVLVKEGE